MHRITDFTLIPVRVSDKTVWQHIVLHSSYGLMGTGEYAIPAYVGSIEGITLSLHNPSGPIAYVASLQLVSILPHRQQHEFQFGELPMFWTSAELAPPRMAHGQSKVPDRSGLGTGLSKHAVTGEKA